MLFFGIIAALGIAMIVTAGVWLHRARDPGVAYSAGLLGMAGAVLAIGAAIGALILLIAKAY